jgi:PAS domain S-box-containing protein
MNNNGHFLSAFSPILSLLQRLDCMLIQLSPDLVIQEFNSGAEILYGCKKEAALNRNFIQFCHEINATPPLQDFSEILLGKAKDASTKHIQWTILPLRSLEHPTQVAIILLVGINIDVRFNIQNMNRKLRYLERIINHVPHSIFWKDVHSIFMGCNEIFAESAGLKSASEIIGKADYDLPWSKQESEAYIEDDRRVMESQEERLNIEETLTINGKQTVLLTSKVPLYDEHGEVSGVLGIFTDITYLKKIEADLREAKLIAEAASKAKSDFIASMSHDIKIPLTGIIGTAKILERDIHDLQEKEHAQNILMCGNRLLELFVSILDNVSADYTNVTDIYLETFDIRREIANITELELLAIQLKNLQLITIIDENIPQYVISDRIKFNRILLNLIGNSIKFTDKGYIEIRVQLLSSNHDQIELKFSVKDTGVGIPANAKEKVFEKFFTVDPTYKGNSKGHGIGLNTAKSYIRLLGSEPKLESKVGEGTTIYFILPMGVGNATDVKNSMPIKRSEITQKKLVSADIQVSQPQIHTSPVENISDMNDLNENLGTVLLIEDDKICSIVAKDMLQKLNYTVITAANAESAFQVLKEKTCTYIITDVGLPGISGDEFVALVRYWEKTSEKTRTPIIALTAHANNPSETKKLISAGVDEVLGKPTNLDAIKNAIDHLTLKF